MVGWMDAVREDMQVSSDLLWQPLKGDKPKKRFVLVFLMFV